MGNMENRYSLNKTDKALLTAVRDKNIVEAKKLLKKGILKSLTRNVANINAYDTNSGDTPLGIAAGNGDIEMAKLLLDAGADVNAREELNSELEGWTALMSASSCGHIDMLKLLLDAGANVNAMTFDGHTGLWYACQNGYIDTVKLLIDKGAKLNFHFGCPFPLGAPCGTSIKK